ncbi:signal peptidase I [Candidatus Neptunichlamydia sp. REUL1]|uniref:signal peptidase I n=1 Tax=Candidatus Neptunichlamydia sp. REUL1 TaxID=3064277 RepID=UPI00292F376E|nr:signal peptidase I [Candidatus Neptunochlamydia sp. REUL1]
MKIYRLKKSLHIFRHILKLYRRKRKVLSEIHRVEVVQTLTNLQEQILEKDRVQASEIAHEAEEFLTLYLKKSPLERIRDFIVGLGLALLVAVLIRTMWFELYEIPTGSMRPTLAEGDRLVVSKTTYGINIPLKRGHFLFDPDLVLRNGTVVFTGAGMDIHDVDTLYFYLFPGKKQFVKRLIGKPGDILYFYGGKIYGIDKNGNDISKDLNPEFLSKIDHVPYIYLNGKMILPEKAQGGIYAPVTLKQMNKAVAKLSLGSTNKVIGEMLPPFKGAVEDYYELWGFSDYGVSRLLTDREVEKYTGTPLTQLGKAPLYMEIIHHPTVKHPKIEKDPMGRLVPSVGTTSSVIPLSQDHLNTLMSNLYTARFIVKDGHAYRYGSKLSQASPKLPGIPNGTYEFYYGKGYQVRFGGIITELPKDHPLYQFTPERMQLLYNLGIEWMTFYAPYTKDQYLLPSRYVYYRDGDLFAMGASMIKKDDPILLKFIQQEYLRQEAAPNYRPHIPFDDPGPPLTSEGEIDTALLQQKGITIPVSRYMALGDNYAMSADSRDFGFVPEENIRGAPDYIFWPPGPRFGAILQVDYPFFNSPRFVVWVLAFVGFGTYYIVHRKWNKLPQKIE